MESDNRVPRSNFSSIEYTSWCKSSAMSRFINQLPVKEKRAIFQLLRGDASVSHDSLLTAYGITAGEFSLWQIIGKRQ